MFNGKEKFLDEFFLKVNFFSSRDEAIELADRAITMTKDERIQEFSELLKEVAVQSKTSKIKLANFFFYWLFYTDVRRRKSSIEKVQEETEGEEEEEEGNKQQPVGDSSILSTAETTEEINPVEKPTISLRKPLAFTQNGSTDEQVSKKKRGRKPKIETNNNSIVFHLI